MKENKKGINIRMHDLFLSVAVPNVFVKLCDSVNDGAVLSYFFYKTPSEDGLITVALDEVQRDIPLSEKELLKSIKRLVAKKLMKANIMNTGKGYVISVLVNKDEVSRQVDEQSDKEGADNGVSE